MRENHQNNWTPQEHNPPVVLRGIENRELLLPTRRTEGSIQDLGSSPVEVTPKPGDKLPEIITGRRNQIRLAHQSSDSGIPRNPGLINDLTGPGSR